MLLQTLSGLEGTTLLSTNTSDIDTASKVKQTNKAKQHSTPKAVTFPRKNELPQYMYICMWAKEHCAKRLVIGKRLGK